jgi:hypothetical protein
MIRLWSRFVAWLFPPMPIVGHRVSFQFIWPDVYTAIEATRPELLPQLDEFGNRPISSFADWLDENYPIEGGWGTRSVGGTAATIRHFYSEHANVGR